MAAGGQYLRLRPEQEGTVAFRRPLSLFWLQPKLLLLPRATSPGCAAGGLDLTRVRRDKAAQERHDQRPDQTGPRIRETSALVRTLRSPEETHSYPRPQKCERLRGCPRRRGFPGNQNPQSDSRVEFSSILVPVWSVQPDQAVWALKPLVSGGSLHTNCCVCVHIHTSTHTHTALICY